MRSEARERRLSEMLVLLLPGLLFLPWIRQFVYLRGAEYSDLLIAHYPNLRFLHDALAAYRAIPLWSPAIQSGFPFFANPLSGLWYPPGWLGVLWPEPWAFNLLAAGHLMFGAWGMARLLRMLGLGQVESVVGGLAFGLLPKLLAHFGAGHVTLVYAVSWTPWLLAAERIRGKVLRPGVLLGVIILADPRWGAYAGLLWLSFSVAHSQETEASAERKWRNLVRRVGGLAREGLLALLLSAPLLIPLLEYTMRSTRAALLPEDVLVFSLPPARLVGLVLPVSGGQVEWVAYPGMVVFGLAVMGVAAGLRPQTRFWAVAAGLSLLLSLGEHIPFMSFLAGLPGANLLRVPARALFLVHFCLVVLAAFGVQGLRGTHRLNVLRMAVAAWAGFSLALLGAGFLAPGLRSAFWWSGGVGLAAAVGCAWAAGSGRFGRAAPALLVLLIFSDGAWFFAAELAPRSKQAVFGEGAAVADWLAARPGRFRVYSPSYSVPQHTAADYGLELADGVDPLQLKTYVDYFSGASGVPYGAYSVTLPPLTGDPATANTSAVPDPERLGRLNVRYVAAAFPIDTPGLELVAQFEETRIYRNLHDKDRVYASEPSGAGPELLEWTPNRIKIDPGGAEEIILAEMMYPGWRVEGGVLETPAPGNLRVISVDESGGPVTLVFRPLSLYAGLLCAFSALLFIFLAPFRSYD